MYLLICFCNYLHIFSFNFCTKLTLIYALLLQNYSILHLAIYLPLPESIIFLYAFVLLFSIFSFQLESIFLEFLTRQGLNSLSFCFVGKDIISPSLLKHDLPDILLLVGSSFLSALRMCFGLQGFC